MPEDDGKIRLECPECRAAMRGPESLLDQLIECPRCKKSISLRRPIEEKAAPPPTTGAQAALNEAMNPSAAKADKKKQCAACGELIPFVLKTCPFCGKDPYEKRINAKKLTGILAGVGCLVLLILAYAVGSFIFSRASAPKEAPAYMKFFDEQTGYHPGVVAEAKRGRMYPETFEHIETKVTEAGGGYIRVFMKYRIKDDDGEVRVHEIMNQVSKANGEVIS